MRTNAEAADPYDIIFITESALSGIEKIICPTGYSLKVIAPAKISTKKNDTDLLCGGIAVIAKTAVAKSISIFIHPQLRVHNIE